MTSLFPMLFGRGSVGRGLAGVAWLSRPGPAAVSGSGCSGLTTALPGLQPPASAASSVQAVLPPPAGSGGSSGLWCP